jgi:tetratricopeptide (TPR) repeat protein
MPPLEQLLGLANSHEESRNDSEAVRVLETAVRLYPTSPEPRLNLAKLYGAYGEWELARIHSSAINSGRLVPEASLVLAQALTSLGRGDEARSPLELALESPQFSGLAAGMLAYWYQARGGFAMSKALFETSIERQPNQSMAYYGWSQSNRFTIGHLPMVQQMENLVDDPQLGAVDSMYLRYVLGKARADLGEYEQSMHQFDLANAAAFQTCLGGRLFNRRRYAEIIDSMIATFTPDFLRRNRGVGSSSCRPIFVLGMMRSGTTLVEQILSSHPEVTAGGELPFWLATGFAAFDVDKRSVDLKRIAKLVGLFEADLGKVSASAQHVTDKTPQNFQALGLIHLAFPRAKVIHIRRNPLDNCVSIYTTPYEKSPDFAHSKESIVFAYRQYQRLMAHWRKVLPAEQFLEIDYEDLTTRPETVTRKLLEFCRLPWDDACLEPENNNRIVTTPSLCQVRQPINRSAVERWRVYEPWLGEFVKLKGLSG